MSIQFKNIMYRGVLFFTIIFFAGLTSGFAQEGQLIPRAELAQVLSPEAMQKLEHFLNAPTKEAQDSLAKFSDQEIVTIWDTYRARKSLSEQRIFWLLQAQLERKADAMAAERLLYLYLALVVLTSLFFLFILWIYLRQKKLIRNFQK